MKTRKIAFGLIALIILVAILFVPFIPVTISVTIPVTEPYQESYVEKESYEREVQYEVVSAKVTEGWDFARGAYHTVSVVIKNVDSKGGTFTVALKLYDVNGLFGEKVVRNYIAPGASVEFKAEFDTKLGQDVRGEYKVIPPTVIDERLVTKTRTVYKTVYKTDYKTVYKSIVEILLAPR